MTVFSRACAQSPTVRNQRPQGAMSVGSEMINNSYGYDVEVRGVFAGVDDAIRLVGGYHGRLLCLGRNGVGVRTLWRAARIFEHDPSAAHPVTAEGSADPLVEPAARVAGDGGFDVLVRRRRHVERL